MKDKGLDIGAYSILGDRDTQQDSYTCERKDTLLLVSVCDGMGGMDGGEFASKAAVNTIIESLRTAPPQSLETTASWMENVLSAADERISLLTDQTGERMHAGSTCVMAVIEGRRFQWGSVGDSRIYRKTSSGLEILTKMHNYHMVLDDMMRKGEITQTVYQNESVKGEALVSFLGMGGLRFIDTSRQPLPLSEGDIILLCSDGLYKSLDDDRMDDILTYMIEVLKKNGFITLVEGVEDESQNQYSVKRGFDYIQGYHYAKPGPIEDLKKYFNRKTSF